MAYPGKKISQLTATTTINDSSLIPVVVTPGVSTETNKITIANAKAVLKGDTGATGPGATADAGTTTTGAPGSSASVVNSGTTSAAIFDFTIPRGDVGATGPQGVKGDTGTGITEQTVGFTLTGGTTPKTLTVALDADVSGTNTGDASGHSALAPIDNPTFTTGITTPAVKITTGAGLNKVLTSDADGDATWAAPATSVSVTTKGDLQTYSTVPDRLPVGTDGQILESRASEATGLKWVAPPPAETTTTIGALINGATAKTSAVDADYLGLMDSEGSNVLKKLSWAYVKSILKTYFDTIYNFFTAAPGSDHTVSGIKTTLTAHDAQAFGDVCFINSDGEAAIGDADAIASSVIVAMCADSSISANASGNYLLHGIARDDSWNFTPGQFVYLSTTGTTGNTLTQTAPTGVDDCVVIVGIATHADRMIFNPQFGSIVERT